MSFHEKSAWACLVSIVLVFVPYLVVVLRYPASFFGLFPLAVLALIGLLTAFHMGNALATRSIRETGDTPPLDELDQLIELRAAKWSGLFLGAAVMMWCLTAMWAIPTLEIADANLALTAIHLLFAAFVAA